MMDISELLQRNRREVQRCLVEFLPHTHPHPDIQTLYQMMWDYPLRPSKGLRATLCLLTCQVFGGDPALALPTATSLELFQNWILIHDDIEDASDLRRGEPCLHVKYGVPMAINVGDALHSQMWRLLLRNTKGLGSALAFRVFEEFMELVDAVVAGQHIELSWVAQDRWEISERDYYEMCERKTASYTCVTPCRLGALIAGAPDAALEALREIGRILGLAFQLQDDVLNLAGDQDKYGKEIAGDLWEGKRTLILIHLLQRCSTAEKLQIQEILSQPRTMKDSDAIVWILERMHFYGSIEYARCEAQRLADQAKQLFELQFPAPPDPKARRLFLELVDFVIRRDH